MCAGLGRGESDVDPAPIVSRGCGQGAACSRAGGDSAGLRETGQVLTCAGDMGGIRLLAKGLSSLSILRPSGVK